MRDVINILLIANNFPPPINGGSIRALKLAKYLTRAGAKVHVLCNHRGQKGQCVHSSDTGNDLDGIHLHYAPGVLRGVYRADESNIESNASFIREILKRLKKIKSVLDKYAIPDLQLLLWVPIALRHAVKLVRSNQFKVVITTSPPPSTHLIGYCLKKLFKNRINWLTDFRDLWSDSPEFDSGLKCFQRANQRLERMVLGSSDYIIYTSESIKRASVILFGAETRDGKKCDVITNGFDEEDFSIEVLPKQSTVTYFGFFGSLQGVNIAPAMRLLEALAILRARGDVAFRVKFVGHFTLEFRARAESLSEFVEIEDAVSHSAAIQGMLECSYLILLLADNMEGRIAYTGKLFEYIRAQKPILAVVPPGEAASLITENSLGIIVDPNDPELIAGGVLRIIATYARSSAPFRWESSMLTKLSREYQAEKLLNIIRRL